MRKFLTFICFVCVCLSIIAWDSGGGWDIGTFYATNDIEVSGDIYVNDEIYADITLYAEYGGCFMILDSDGAGWTECSALNGTLSCATDADGVCDGSL